jgi:hypothetical protein
LSVIEKINREAVELRQRLLSSMPIDDASAELVAQRHQELEDASSEAGRLSAGLLAIRRVHKDIYTRRDEVMGILRQIENIIAVLGSALSPYIPPKPVEYRAGELHSFVFHIFH